MRGWRALRQPLDDERAWEAASDAELIRAARLDRRALAPLYQRYRDDLLRYCFYCLENWEEAADAAHDIFLSAFGGLHRLSDREDAFRAYLFRTAHNEMYDVKHRRWRRPTETLDDQRELADPTPSPEYRAIVSDDYARVVALLVRLPADRRRVCELRFAGRSDKEIAWILGKSEGAVRTAWSRAVAQLHDLMGIKRSPTGGRDA